MHQQQQVIDIVSYKKEWPGEFASIAGALRGALGSLALRIDHIGSTSVPGLAAKDRIDIQVTVRSADDFGSVQSKLEGIGYTVSPVAVCDHVPPWGPYEDEQWVKRFFRPPAGQRPTNLHVRVAGRANQQYALLFRDYLRAHALVADGYAAAKRRLAQYHAQDSDAYCDIKDPICDIIAVGANAWALETSWELGSSDA